MGTVILPVPLLAAIGEVWQTHQCPGKCMIGKPGVADFGEAVGLAEEVLSGSCLFSVDRVKTPVSRSWSTTAARVAKAHTSGYKE
ncbi:hypothetical protein GOODEAATRI_028630 [Goodea atripinnis]|uniref:Uncharacterized protein n=1 Tax=Goodea atripinnis TaxID=208336 RepID=A0ABV0PHT3_9TELE